MGLILKLLIYDPTNCEYGKQVQIRSSVNLQKHQLATFYNNFLEWPSMSSDFCDSVKQAMITLRGMAEHMFSTVYNQQHFTLL